MTRKIFIWVVTIIGLAGVFTLVYAFFADDAILTKISALATFLMGCVRALIALMPQDKKHQASSEIESKPAAITPPATTLNQLPKKNPHYSGRKECLDNQVKDFFISYTKKDEEWAKWMGAVLENNGFSCFCQYKDMKPGQNFLLEMDKAIKNCERIISILSPAYIQSFFADEEWTGFLAQKKYANIIPVRIEDFVPDGLWAARVYIDIAGKSKKDAEPLLLKELEHLKKTPPSEPVRVTTLPETVKINPNFPKQNRFFTGRDIDLQKIHRTLNKSETVAITGMGGIGKSQIAIEYAYRYAAEYQYIWWVNAETPETISEAYHSFAQKIKLVAPDEKIERTIDCVKDWMRENGHWLFIFDNAEDEKTLERYLPSLYGKERHILVTSRNTKFRNITPMIIKVFVEEEACQFIEKLTKKPVDEHFKELAEKMGCLPLALDHAGAYMNHNKMSYREYLVLYDKHNLELLADDDDPDKRSVATTLKISFDKINNLASHQLLNLFAYFAPDNISRQWFKDASDVLPDELCEVAANDLKYQKAIAELDKYSIITIDENGLISIHRLVQEVIRHNLKNEQTKWRNYCVSILNELCNFEFHTAELRARFLVLAAHVETATIAISDDSATEEIANLYVFLGRGFKDLAEYQKALDWYEKAKNIRENVLGKEHPDTATTYNNIAGIYRAQGEYKNALEYYDKALTIREKVLGKEHPDTATTYNNIALVYNAQGEYEKALEYYDKDLAISEKVLGKEHPDTATTYNNIAGVYRAQGDYEKALEFFKKVSAIFEKFSGKEHPYTATTYNNIAGVYDDQGDYEKALEYYEKSLDIKVKVLGKEHPSTATTYNNIAGVYHEQDNYERALEWYLKSLPVLIKVLGFEHPDTKTVLNNMATAYEKSGKTEPFEEWLEKKVVSLK